MIPLCQEKSRVKFLQKTFFPEPVFVSGAARLIMQTFASPLHAPLATCSPAERHDISQDSAVLSVRPKVAELVFQLYGRSLHPELFDVFASRTIKRGDYEVTAKITSASHPLPLKRRLMSYKLRGERHDHMALDGVRYRTQFQLEPVSPEVFWTYQQELHLDGIRNGLMHRFDSSGRMALGALSYINVESRNRSLIVQAFHTFPDDYAIVKTQSVYEI
jgi:hypothetical protein